MYARRQPDEFVDEDDMDDEELVRLVDQTNEDFSGSMTEDVIYIEEKVLEPSEPRGPAVGADTSEDSMSISDRGTPDRMYKLVLAGDAAVGKSSFIIRLCRNKFYSALNSTLGNSIYLFVFVFSFYFSICTLAHLHTCTLLFVCLFVCLHICLFAYLFVCLFINIFVCLFIY